MSVWMKLMTLINGKVMSREEALAVIKTAEQRVSNDVDGQITVGEMLSIFVEMLGASTTVAATLIALAGIVVGLFLGVGFV